VARLLQRKVGWSHASQQGKKWNDGEHTVGKVRRIPLDDLAEGTDASVKGTKGRMIPGLSTESATGRAIVLVPAGLDAKQSIEVAVFLHGWTEGLHRPYAGYRELVDPKPSTADQSRALQERLPRLRQGLDSTDTAPVRDVALDQAEQQLEESGQKQLVIVLPQGGLKSQFGKQGTKDFDAGPYVTEIVTRLKTEKCWKDAKGQVVDAAPSVTRVVMAGHSGAGAALSHMADEAVNAKKGVKPKKGEPPAKSSALTADLVLYDAINGGELGSFENWAAMRLEEDLAVLTSSKTDAEKLAYLRDAPKLRGYTTDFYIDQYILLDDFIEAWFARNKKQLGAWAPCLRANYSLDYLDVDHEELMRGSLAGQPRAAGTGNILDAINALHRPAWSSQGACPPIPKSLRKRKDAIKAAGKAPTKK
jgi:hypothetical protein